MALLEIIQIPDPRLKKPSRKVMHIDDDLRGFIADMDETMCFHDGVGLAAVQVGLHKRICMIRIPRVEEEELEPDEAIAILESDDEEAKKGIYVIEEESDDEEDEKEHKVDDIPLARFVRRKIVWPESRILINPKIVEKEGAIIDDEGCLSDMGYQAKVERCRRIVIVAQDLDLNTVTIEATGLEARALQHEIDHLEGIIYHDRMIEDTRELMGEEDEDEEEGEDEENNNQGDVDE